LGKELDIEDLFYHILGKTEEEVEDLLNEGDIEEEVFQKYNINFTQYCNIVIDLLPFTVPFLGLDKNQYHAFVDHEKRRAIVKLQIK